MKGQLSAFVSCVVRSSDFARKAHCVVSVRGTSSWTGSNSHSRGSPRVGSPWRFFNKIMHVLDKKAKGGRKLVLCSKHTKLIFGSRPSLKCYGDRKLRQEQKISWMRFEHFRPARLPDPMTSPGATPEHRQPYLVCRGHFMTGCPAFCDDFSARKEKKRWLWNSTLRGNWMLVKNIFRAKISWANCQLLLQPRSLTQNASFSSALNNAQVVCSFALEFKFHSRFSFHYFHLSFSWLLPFGLECVWSVMPFTHLSRSDSMRLLLPGVFLCFVGNAPLKQKNMASCPSCIQTGAHDGSASCPGMLNYRHVTLVKAIFVSACCVKFEQSQGVRSGVSASARPLCFGLQCHSPDSIPSRATLCSLDWENHHHSQMNWVQHRRLDWILVSNKSVELYQMGELLASSFLWLHKLTQLHVNSYWAGFLPTLTWKNLWQKSFDMELKALKPDAA